MPCIPAKAGGQVVLTVIEPGIAHREESQPVRTRRAGSRARLGAASVGERIQNRKVRSDPRLDVFEDHPASGGAGSTDVAASGAWLDAVIGYLAPTPTNRGKTP